MEKAVARRWTAREKTMHNNTLCANVEGVMQSRPSRNTEPHVPSPTTFPTASSSNCPVNQSLSRKKNGGQLSWHFCKSWLHFHPQSHLACTLQLPLRTPRLVATFIITPAASEVNSCSLAIRHSHLHLEISFRPTQDGGWQSSCQARQSHPSPRPNR